MSWSLHGSSSRGGGGGSSSDYDRDSGNDGGSDGDGDADGDAATKYEVKTSSKGHKFWLPSNNPFFYANGGAELPANEIDQFWIKGDSKLTQTVQFRAYDGTAWSNWTSVSVKTQAINNLPVVSILNQTVIKGNRINAKEFNKKIIVIDINN